MTRLALALPALACVPGLAAQGDSARPSVDTTRPATVVEVEHTFRSGELTLSGTVALPADSAASLPLVVMVGGSGPVDRNGNARRDLRANLYAQLAWRLAARGVASFRYDKRVLPTTIGPVDVASLTLDDLAHDASAAMASLRDDARFQKIVLLGHGEGGTVAIRALRMGGDVDGLVLAATAGRPLRVLLREQLRRQLDDASLARFDRAMDRYLRGEAVEDLPPVLAPLFHPIDRTFMLSAITISPPDELAALTVPVLIVQGETDLQMSPRDARNLQAARPDARVVIIRGANHVFKRIADTTLTTQLAVYADPTRPVVPELVEAVVEFVRSVSGER